MTFVFLALTWCDHMRLTYQIRKRVLKATTAWSLIASFPPHSNNWSELESDSYIHHASLSRIIVAAVRHALYCNRCNHHAKKGWRSMSNMRRKRSQIHLSWEWLSRGIVSHEGGVGVLIAELVPSCSVACYKQHKGWFESVSASTMKFFLPDLGGLKTFPKKHPVAPN